MTDPTTNQTTTTTYNTANIAVEVVVSDASSHATLSDTRPTYTPAGRLMSCEQVGRAPLYTPDNPYVYAGANPLSNVDPSGRYRAAARGSQVESWAATNRTMAQAQASRVIPQAGTPPGTPAGGCGSGGGTKTCLGATTPAGSCDRVCKAQNDATSASDTLDHIGNFFTGPGGLLGLALGFLKMQAGEGGPANPLFLGVASIAALLSLIGFQLQMEAGAFWIEAQQGSGFWTNETAFTAASGIILAIGTVITALIGTAWLALTALNAEDPVLGALSFVGGLFATIGAAIGAVADEFVAVQAIGKEAKDMGYY